MVVERLDGAATTRGAGPLVRVDGQAEDGQHRHDDLSRRGVPLALDVPVPGLDAVRARVSDEALEQVLFAHGAGVSAVAAVVRPRIWVTPRNGMAAQSGRWLSS